MKRNIWPFASLSFVFLKSATRLGGLFGEGSPIGFFRSLGGFIGGFFEFGGSFLSTFMKPIRRKVTVFNPSGSLTG
jgi:hypothetical protein